MKRITTELTRRAVLSAIGEYDAIGQDAFLAKYGFGPARTYRLWHEGRSYDSKAIVGAAFGYLPGRSAPLRYDEFSGGLVQVVPVLERLGFCFSPPRIFASSVWGSDLNKWGAWGFADKGTRDRLAALIAPGDFVLSIGTMGPETQSHEQGRLLALMTIGSELIETRELVEPDFYRESVETNGRERWPYGFPIKTAERFEPAPLRSVVLPRLAEQNLHRVLARHFVELTPAEVAAVLALPRVNEPNIYATPVSAFAARIRKSRPGPPPTRGTRMLTVTSGPAATYVMQLSGSALSAVVQPVLPDESHAVYKVGFSNDPDRRLRELNAYLPCDQSLCWTVLKTQWHDDEINAWAMEQEIFRLLDVARASRFKGEMLAATTGQIGEAWTTALRTTRRPTAPVIVDEDD